MSDKKRILEINEAVNVRHANARFKTGVRSTTGAGAMDDIEAMTKGVDTTGFGVIDLSGISRTLHGDDLVAKGNEIVDYLKSKYKFDVEYNPKRPLHVSYKFDPKKHKDGRKLRDNIVKYIRKNIGYVS